MHLPNIFVRSKLEYGSQIWSPYQLDDIDLIESVQREFTRRIPAIKKYIKKQKLKKNSFTYSYPERLKALKVDSLEIRRIRADLVMLYKMYHEKVNLNFNDFFTVSTHKKTRSNGLEEEEEEEEEISKPSEKF